ncbi:mechanosensitive ion channel family protein [Halovivax sp.]|uniref:mechanosensitive ion channel family protein n=1 Tax=Halovivax sp. TaxID=1935978 RepID=UPI0025C6D398|nr:mechanosensitive ion channel family protein [Halovivax sp.]
MVEPLTALDWLADTFETTNQRLAVTVVVLAVLAAVLLRADSMQRWLNRRIRPLYADVIAAAVFVGTCVLAGAVVIGVWEQTGELRALWAEYDLGGDTVARLLVSAVLLLTAYIVARFVERLIADVLGTAASVTDHQREVTYRVSQVVIYAMTLVVVLGIWIDDLGAIFVGAGFLGIVLGMAARQTLGSLIAGFVLMFSRPFEIGDWIVVDDQHEGIVTDISIVNTRIKSFDGEYVIVPNDVVGSSAVANRSRTGRLRVEVEVGVDYDVDVERASRIASEAVAELDASLDAPEPGVVSKSFEDSAVLLGVRFWIDNPSARRFNRSRTEAIHAIKEAFADAGIKIPFPQRELAGRAETGGFRVAGEHLRYEESESDSRDVTETESTTGSDAAVPPARSDATRDGGSPGSHGDGPEDDPPAEVAGDASGEGE